MIPVLPDCLPSRGNAFPRRVSRALLDPFEPSGDYEADLPRLQALYEGVRGLRD